MTCGDIYCIFCKLPIYGNLLNRQFKVPDYDWIKTDLGCALSFTDELHPGNGGDDVSNRIECKLCNIDNDDYLVLHNVCYNILLKFYNNKIKNNITYYQKYCNKYINEECGDLHSLSYTIIMVVIIYLMK